MSQRGNPLSLLWNLGFPNNCVVTWTLRGKFFITICAGPLTILEGIARRGIDTAPRIETWLPRPLK
jgi:hypothetical protein